MGVVISRRGLLAGLGATAGLAALGACGSAAAGRQTAAVTSPGAPAPSAPLRSPYGTDASQFGELYRPSGTSRPGVVVVLHGGFWRAQYDLSLGRPLAADLARRGYTAWNLEYRRVGIGGGWTGTFDDVAAGIDHLATLDVDTSRVVTVGHSAGGHLAVWSAGRGGLPAGAPGSSPRVPVTAAVSQAGVLALAVAAREAVGGSAVPDLMGGLPDRVPDRYAVGDPVGQVPLSTPVLCVHSHADEIVPFDQSERYVAAATGAGARARLVETQGDHFTLIDPASPDWAAVVDALPDLMG